MARWEWAESSLARVTAKSFAAPYLFLWAGESRRQKRLSAVAPAGECAITISVLRLIIAETERPSRTLRAPTCAYITSLLLPPLAANRIAAFSPYSSCCGKRGKKIAAHPGEKFAGFFNHFSPSPDNTRKVCVVSCGRSKFAYIEKFAAGSKGRIPRHFLTIAAGDISLFAPAAATTAEHKLFAIRRRAAPGRKGFCQISLGKKSRVGQTFYLRDLNNESSFISISNLLGMSASAG